MSKVVYRRGKVDDDDIKSPILRRMCTFIMKLKQTTFECVLYEH